MSATTTAVTNNPVTTTAAVGLVVQGVLAMFGASAEVQANVAQITLGAAVLFRGFIAWWENRSSGEA